MKTGPYKRLVRTLVDAFIDDPLYVWLYPDAAARPMALEATMTLTLDLAESNGVIDHDPEGTAVAVWTEPGRELLGDPRPFLDLLARWAPQRAEAAMAGMIATGRHRPQADVWILHLLAVSPNRQGRGLASQLLQPVLDTAATDDAAVYLETSNPRNVSFYQRFGFALLGEVPVPEGGPLMRPMLRVPPAPADSYV